MATLTVQKPGAALTYGSAATTDTFANDGKTMLHVKNQNAGTVTVTVNSQVNCNQGSDHDEVHSLNTGVDKLIGPWDPARFNDANNRVVITTSPFASVTLAAIHTG